MEITPKDKKIANEAYKTEEYLKENFRRIKVTYNDGHVIKFKIDTWLLHRNDIRNNLFKKQLCKVEPVKKFKIFGI